MYGGGGDGNSFGRGECAVQLGFRRGEEHNERNVLPFDPARRIAARAAPLLIYSYRDEILVIR